MNRGLKEMMTRFMQAQLDTVAPITPMNRGLKVYKHALKQHGVRGCTDHPDE